jgi:DNA replication protein DnaC
MNNQQTEDLLEGLKLKGMAKAFADMIQMPVQQRPGMELAVAKLVDAERSHRKNMKTELYLKTSRLRYNAVLEDVIFSTERNLTKDQLAEIGDCSFIRRAENILITGLTGCGKSFLACSIGRQACMTGYRTEYFNMNKFIEKIALSKIDGTFLKVITRLEKNDLIILDDFALQPLDQHARLALLQILEERYERKSILITSQLPVGKWYDYIGEPTLADAIMDRLINNAILIDLKGQSLRKKNRRIQGDGNK